MTSPIGRPQAAIPPYMTTKICEFYNHDLTQEDRASSKTSEEDSLASFSSEEHAVRKKTAITTFTSRPTSVSPRETWDANTRKLLISSKDPSSVDATEDTDAIATDLHMQITDLFFRTAFSKYPINNTSHLMRCYVHDQRAYNNAFWYPSDESLHFGEVDPAIFTPLVLNLGVAAHEVTHAYTEFSANLEYFRQSGALNESMSDVYAIMTKHFKASMGQSKPVDASSENADWLIGEKTIVNDPKNGTALRSMKDPGKAYKNHPVLGNDPQPADMSGYEELPGTNDDGGVHLYSGIPNRAFYLAASNIGGPSWEKPGKIWDRALFSSTSDESFATFAAKTVKAVKALGYHEGVTNTVGQAWTTVGVLGSSTATTSTPTPTKHRRCCILQ